MPADEWVYTRHFAWLPRRSSRIDKREYLWLKHYYLGKKWSPNPLVDYTVRLNEQDFTWFVLAEKNSE